MRVPRRRFQPPRWAYELERRVLAAVKRSEERVLSSMDDRLDALEARNAELGQAIQDEIAQLRDALAAGGPTDAQLARLDDLASQLQGEADSLRADDTPPPAP